MREEKTANSCISERVSTSLSNTALMFAVRHHPILPPFPFQGSTEEVAVEPGSAGRCYLSKWKGRKRERACAST